MEKKENSRFVAFEIGRTKKKEDLFLIFQTTAKQNVQPSSLQLGQNFYLNVMKSRESSTYNLVTMMQTGLVSLKLLCCLSPGRSGLPIPLSVPTDVSGSNRRRCSSILPPLLCFPPSRLVRAGCFSLISHLHLSRKKKKAVELEMPCDKKKERSGGWD